MRQRIVYALLGLVGGMIVGPLIAWWVVRPHDAKFHGEVAALFNVPIGGIVGLIVGLRHANFHLRKHGPQSWPSAGWFLVILPLMVFAVVVIELLCLGVPFAHIRDVLVPDMRRWFYIP